MAVIQILARGSPASYIQCMSSYNVCYIVYMYLHCFIPYLIIRNSVKFLCRTGATTNVVCCKIAWADQRNHYSNKIRCYIGSDATQYRK